MDSDGIKWPADFSELQVSVLLYSFDTTDFILYLVYFILHYFIKHFDIITYFLKRSFAFL